MVLPRHWVGYADGGSVQPSPEDIYSHGNGLGPALNRLGGWFGKEANQFGNWAGKEANQFGHWFGQATGTTPYQTDPNAFKLPGYDAQQQNLGGIGTAAQGLMDPSQQAGARAQQGQLASMLFQQANGGGPNPAMDMLKQSTGRNIASAYAMAQSNPNDAGAARSAAERAGDMNQQASGEAATMRAQQQLAAQSQLGGLLGGMRGQDQGLMGMGYQGALGAAGLQGGLSQAQLQAMMQQQQMQQQAYQNATGASRGLIGGALGALGSAIIPKGGGTAPSSGGFSIPGMAHGGPVLCLVHGGGVPGRAQVPGDDEENDTVDAELSPGEIVLPRSVTQDEDAPERAAAFVRAIQAKHKRKAA